MRRGEIRYANLGGRFGRRPVLVLTATEIVPVLNAITCAPITTSLRDIPTRVPLGRLEGLAEPSEAVCDALATIPREDIDTVALGSMPGARMAEVDRAIARALDIRRANLVS